MDEVGEDIMSDDNSEDYEREQLEIALYSQIHFEQNDEYKPYKRSVKSDDDNADDSDEDFVISVEGNEKKGFVGNETNADIVLNEVIENRFRELKARSKGKNESLPVKTIFKKGKTKPSKIDSAAPSILKTFGKSSSVVKEINTASKIHAMLRSSSGIPSTRKRVTAESLILLNDSEGDNEKDESVIDVDKDSDVDMVFSSASGDIMTDSDIDSLDILLGESDDEKRDIKMNVHSNPRYTYKKMSNEDSLPCDEEGKDKGHWVINTEDSYRDLISTTVHKARYYKPIRCHNCDKEGHLSKNCPQPKKVIVCIMCAEPGHVSRNCPQAMCFNCEEPGHDMKTCLAPRRSLNFTCYRCNMQGHDQNQCPDSWRQYHVTVTPGKIQHLPKQTKRKRTSCFNCGEEGHLGHECDEERMSRFTRISSPFICRYQSMKEINYLMRRFDEAEERPLKRTRSEGWISGMEKSDRNFRGTEMKITFDTNIPEKRPNRRENEVESEDFVRGKNKKKPSPFVHIVKKHPDNKTGRNNFDKMQFAKLNKKNSYENLKESIKIPEQSKKKKSKKKKKETEKRKNDSKFSSERANWQEMGTGKRPCEMDRVKAINSIESLENKGKDNTYKTREQDGKRDDRKVTMDSSSMDITIIANRDSSEIHNTNEKLTGSESNSFKGSNRNRSLKQSKKNSKSCSSLPTVVIDLTIDSEITSRNLHEDKSAKVQRKYSNARNDRFREDDLFSMQKIQKLQSGGQFDAPVEEEDMEHQVHNNEWWKKIISKSKKRRNRRKKQNKHVVFD